MNKLFEFDDYNKEVSPIFRYIGGKTWLKEYLRKHIEQSLNKYALKSYCEPFSGGLGAFLGVYDVLLNNGVKTVLLNDINKKLMAFYSNLSPIIFTKYKEYEQEFLKTIPESAFATKDPSTLKPLLEDAELYFNKIKHKFNHSSDDDECSACLLFLQNHSFNGIYRENKKGFYNTPFDWSAKIVNLNNIENKINDVKNVFSKFNVVFSSQSFECLDYNKETLYYLDPPYINDDINENNYNKDSFNINKQIQLIDLISDKHFIYSNHYSEQLINRFKDCNILKISRKNIISGNKESRKNDKLEVLISSK